MAVLLMIQGANAGQRYPLDGREILIGRQPDVHIVLDSREVSRKHARITQESGRHYLEDLGSSNGTFLNNNRIEGREELQAQDEIRLGPYRFRYELAAVSEDRVQISLELSAHTANEDLFKLDASKKLQAVLEIASQLGRSLDLQELLPRLLDHLLKLFPQADRGLILMQEGEHLVVRSLVSRRSDRGTGPTYSRTVVRRVMEEGVGLVAEDIMSDHRFSSAMTLSHMGVRSLMCVPLKSSGGRMMGVLQLDRFGMDAPFKLDDLHLLTAIALQVAIVLENAALHAELIEQERLKRDLAVAREIQEGYLPRDFTPLPESQLELFAKVYPAREVSGDYYDFFPLDERRLAFVVADVSGKGIPAGLFMTGARTLHRHLVQKASGPAALLQELNDALAADNPAAMFITMIAGMYDAASGEVVMANAGHPPALHRKRDGSVQELGLTPGRLLGFAQGKLPLAETRLRLEPEDALVLYTDGVTEALGTDRQSMFGIERLCATIAGLPGGQPLRQWCDGIRQAIQQFTTVQELHDDITLLLLRRPTNHGG